MLHYNWGGKSHGFSYGVEASWWTPTDLLPQPLDEDEPPMVGMDLGFEVQGERLRLYSEAQYGFYVGGSAGPYLEVSPDRPLGYGLQGSVWGLLGLGFDVRARYGTSGFVLSPGAMGKIGSCAYGCPEF